MHKAWGMQGSAEVKHAQKAPVWRAALAAARLKQRVSLLVMVGNAVINNGLLLSLRDGLLLLVMLQIPQPVKMLRDREHAKEHMNMPGGEMVGCWGRSSHHRRTCSTTSCTPEALKSWLTNSGNLCLHIRAWDKQRES